MSSANLRFFVNNTGSANTRIDVYPLTKNWNSTGTNWTKATAATSWTTAGGDYDASNLLGSFVPSTNNQYYSVSGAAVNALVQSWINNSAVNFGVILVMVGDSDEVQIRSVEQTLTTQDPELVVTTGVGTSTLNPSQDTFIEQNSPTSINATTNPLKVLNAAGEQRATLQWDVSSLPPAAQVVNATVKLYFTSGNSNVKLNLYRADKTWDEATATWMLAQTASPWAIPGGDFTTSLGDFQAPSSNNSYKSYSSAALAALVQGWIDGSITNQGLLILPTSTGTGQAATFASSENATQLFRPELSVTYLSDVITQTVQTKIPVGTSGGQDTYIDVDAPGNNFGNATTVLVNTDNLDEQRALVRFDVSSLAGQTASSTVLTFTVNNASVNTRVDVYAVTTSWTDSTVTWNSPWTTPGGDFNTGTLIGTFVPSANGAFTISSAQLTSLVNSWITSGAANFGLVLVAKGTADDVQIRAMENGTAANRPQLKAVTGSGTTVRTPSQDAYLDENQPTTAHNSDPLSVLQASTEMRGIVQWDLSAYQPDVTVTAASMRFNVNAFDANVLVSLYRALQSWTEGTGSNGSDADWLRHDTGQTWATAGGDFNTTAFGSFTPSATGWVTITNPAVISLVQGWLDGSITNNGVFLLGTGAANKQVAFNSVGTVDNALSPQLIFTFDTNSRETRMAASPSLVSSGGAIQVSMELSASQTITNVTPTVTISATNGVTAVCGSPTPSAPADVVAGTLKTFTFTCTPNANGNIGDLIFNGSATAANGSVFAEATSNSVLVTPPLTFRVTVNSPASVSVVENIGYIKDASLLPTTASNPALTSLSPSIGDFVFVDFNGDGVLNGADAGISGVVVQVTDGTNVYTATTDSNGAYRVFGLTASVPYTVTLDQASLAANYPGYLPTYGADSKGVTDNVTLTSGQQYSAADFGLRPPGGGSIGDTVWLDSNENGAVDGSETGLPAITVQLYDAADSNLLATTTTDASGHYSFTGLYAGTYKVQVVGTSVVTTSYGITSTLAAAMDLVSVAGSTTPLNNPLTVVLPTDTSAVTTADFGYNWSGQIGDLTFYDNNGNGVFDGGDTNAPKVTQVLFYDADGDGKVSGGDPIVAVVETDGSGAYLVDNLPPGNYVMDPDEQTVESPTTPGKYMAMITSTPETIAFTLGTGAGQSMTNLNVDSGFIEAAIVEGYVFHDVNSNGLKDGSEPGLPLVSVTITGTNISGNPVNITMDTDPDGEYKFIVPPGNYTISYNTADGDIPAALGTQTTPVSTSFTALAGSEYKGSSFDFGLDNTGSIGDLIWHDVDGDGVQDVGEGGLSGVAVLLYDSAGTTLLASTVTTASGGYLFTGLADGTYTVRVDTTSSPNSYGQTADPDVAGSCGGSCDNQSLATVVGGGGNLTEDFGYRDGGVAGAATVTLAGNVWYDTDKQGDFDTPGESVIANVQVNVSCSDGFNTSLTTSGPPALGGNWSVTVSDNISCTVTVNTATLPNAAYTQTGDPDQPGVPCTICNSTTVVVIGASAPPAVNFGYVEELGSISGTVCAGSGDGICNPGEPALTGVTVTLRYAGTDGFLNTSDDVVQPLTTDASGNYTFTNLLPGLYQITETNPANYTSLADADGGNPDNISPVNLAVGQTITNRDFEDLASAVSLTGTVFDDANGSQVQNGLEAGTNAGGLVVNLLNGSNNVVATTAVNANGLYTFTSVAPNTTYTLQLTTNAGTPGQPAPATALPSGWVTTGENTSGTADGTPNSLLTAVVAASNVTQKNFGIEQLPNSNPVTAPSQPNPGGTISVTVPALSGTDPEDGALSTGMTLTITSLPTNGTLYYNNTPVTLNQVITNYDPTKLTLDPNNGAITVIFTYAVTDAAGKTDPTPATATMRFDTPDFVVTKTLNTPSPVRKGETISFTIRITNTGSVTLTTVPLRDTYIDGLIVYVGATPAANAQTSGLIDWNDLTAATANGFGRDLGIGDHFEVVVTFVGLTDTGALPGGETINTATVHDASYDPDGPGGNPPYSVADKSATAGVGITNPTAVALAEASANYANGQASLYWRTANESDVLGLRIYRSEDGGQPVLLAEMAAQKPGQSDGASYDYTDATVEMGKRYSYAVELIGASGSLGQAAIGEVTVGARLFLPTVGR